MARQASTKTAPAAGGISVPLPAEAVVGFAVLDPMYSGGEVLLRGGGRAGGWRGDGRRRGGKLGVWAVHMSVPPPAQVIGYYANIVRTTANAHPGTAGLLIQVV